MGITGNRLLAVICVVIFTSPFLRAAPAREQIPVTWDSWGVPHIEASSENALAYAAGWTQMRSHANAVLTLMARSRGRLAETPGQLQLDYALAQDRWVHQMGIASTALQWWEQQQPVERESLQSFADGINDYATAHRGEIDDELRAVLPIQAVDVLARLAHVMLYDFAVSAAKVGDDTRAWRAGAEPAIASVQNRGSNAVAIAPRKSGSAALLLSNPHLPWSDLVRWFEYESVTPHGNFYGVSLLGLPTQVIGFNQKLGWTHTVNPMHSYYLYELKLKGDGYLLDGEPTAFQTRTETIRLRQPSGEFIDKLITFSDSLFGPVVARNKDRALALWVTGKDAAHTLTQYRDMARAQDHETFNRLLKRQQIAIFSIIYADRDGKIAYYFGGRNPASRNNIHRDALILDGSKRANLWTDVLPLEQLPAVIDPESGWVQNANDPPWTATQPARLSSTDYAKGLVTSTFVNLRAQRIIQRLEATPTIDFNALLNLKLDTGSELALRTLDDLIAAGRQASDPDSQVGARILSGWDRAMNADSRGAVLFSQWVKLMPGDDNIFTIPFDPRNPLAGPRGLAVPAKAAGLLGEAVRGLRETGVAPDVAWGELFKLPGAQRLPANGGPDPLGLIRATYFAQPGPTPGYIANGGDGFSAVVEFGTQPRAMGLLAYGNFTEPSPPGVRDQMQLYADKRLRTLLRAPVDSSDIVLKELIPYSPNHSLRAADTGNRPVPTMPWR
ncbi:penicillin acylase family protein [Pseudomonas sp. CFBP 13711]|uniref:penicillin acylase family protein n=1 Tax=unclassified Pseudomonas TaxID=196821 RepID=UPI00177B36ED|nr:MULTISPECIES: penicillin acylase family protein [unclassified Pseudomonas]MBD8708479.1 penicillin acylase family protein [Pseudomonas sp. CFBP 13711]MBD8713921.1 penicillin acylase family protein [Pseudomonas sp. CFBP 13715]